MAEIKLDYVNSFINRHGKPCHQFRRKGHPKVTIKGRPGSPEFMARYHQLIEKTGGSSTIEIGATHTKAGSVSDLLVKYYKSDVFKKGLAMATQKTWRSILERFREHQTPSGRCYGENPIATIKKKSITDFLNGKTANSQKNTLKPIKGLIRYAISEGDLAHDPSKEIELISPRKPWVI